MGTEHFTIIGGGIAGLATAIAIAKKGHTVVVHEKVEKFENVGAGLQLGPNAARALKKIGAWDAVLPVTSSPPAIHMRDGRSGEMLKTLELGEEFEKRFGEKYRVALRADLHSALLEVANSLSNISIQLGSDVKIADWLNSGPVIGADGVWSPSRESLFANSSATITKDKFFRNLVSTPIIAGIEMDCVNLWLHPGGHVVHYPVGKNQDLNIVAITDGTEPVAFYGRATSALQNLIYKIPQWSEWPSTYVEPLKSWSIKNHALLVGDAAHGTLPYLAQGAAMALEDAAVLANDLSSSKNTEVAFRMFQMRRMKRTKKLHFESLNAGQVYHLSGIAATARNFIIKKIPSQLFLTKLAWIYNGN